MGQIEILFRWNGSFLYPSHPSTLPTLSRSLRGKAVDWSFRFSIQQKKKFKIGGVFSKLSEPLARTTKPQIKAKTTLYKAYTRTQITKMKANVPKHACMVTYSNENAWAQFCKYYFKPFNIVDDEKRNRMQPNVTVWACNGNEQEGNRKESN